MEYINIRLFKRKLKKDLMLSVIILIISIPLIFITFNINLSLKYEIIWIFSLMIYGIYTAYIFIKPGLDYQIWMKMQNLNLKQRLSNSSDYIYEHNKGLILYAVFTSILMKYCNYYIKANNPQFRYFSVIFLEGSLFGASIYGLYRIRSELRKIKYDSV